MVGMMLPTPSEVDAFGAFTSITLYSPFLHGTIEG